MSGQAHITANGWPADARRIAAFAGLSLALHSIPFFLLQTAGRREPAPLPEIPAATLIDLDLPEPDQELAPAPAPEAPEAPPPPPSPPEEAAPIQEAPAPPAEPEEQVEQPSAAAREAEEAEAAPPEGAPGASVVIPGLTYEDGGDLAVFGHALECASLNARYEERCADIGPIYLTGDVPRLAPQIPEEWRERQAWEQARADRLESQRSAIPMPCAGGDHDCVDSLPRIRDNPAVRDALRGVGIVD